MAISLAGIKLESDAQLGQVVTQVGKLMEKNGGQNKEEIEKLLVNLLAVYINRAGEEEYKKLCKYWLKITDRRNLDVIPDDLRPSIIDLTCTGLGLVVLVFKEKRTLLKAWLALCKEDVVLFLFRAYLKHLPTQMELVVLLIRESVPRVSDDNWMKMGEGVRKVITLHLVQALKGIGRPWWFLQGEEEMSRWSNVDQVCNIYYQVDLEATNEFIKCIYERLSDLKARRTWIMHWLKRGVFMKLEDDTLMVYAASLLMKQNRFEEALVILAIDEESAEEDEEELRMRAKRYELAGYLYAHKQKNTSALECFVKSVVVYMRQKVALQVGSDAGVIAGRCEKIVQLLFLLSNSQFSVIPLTGVAIWERFIEPLVIERISKRPVVLDPILFGERLHFVSKLLSFKCVREMSEPSEEGSLFQRLYKAIINQFDSPDIITVKMESEKMTPAESFLSQYLDSLRTVIKTPIIESIDTSEDPRVILKALTEAMRQNRAEGDVMSGRLLYLRRKASLLLAFKRVYESRKPELKREVEYYLNELLKIPKCLYPDFNATNIERANEKDLVIKAILREDEEALGEFIKGSLQTASCPLLQLALRYYCDLPMEAYDVKVPRTITRQHLEDQLQSQDCCLNGLTWILCIKEQLVIVHKTTVIKKVYPKELEEEFERIVRENRESVGKEVTKKATESEDWRRMWWRKRKDLDKQMSQIINALREILEPLAPILDDNSMLGLCRKCKQLPWEEAIEAKGVVRVFFLNQPKHQFDNSGNVSYLLNPQGDLIETERTFSPLLKDLKGVTGRLPSEEEFAELLRARHFLFFGHSGPKTLCTNCKCKSVLMGCSSARGERSATLRFLRMGAPLVVGNLWDVTDRDIDRLTLKFLSRLDILHSTFGDDFIDDLEGEEYNWAKELSRAREECLLRFLNGAAPVLYVNANILLCNNSK